MNIINLQKQNEILFIFSSFPVDSPIKQYPMYEVFNMNVLKELQASIDAKTTMENLAFINTKYQIDIVDDEICYLINLLSNIDIEKPFSL